eukprot:GAHX01003527.1.p1 GENE.GAHX01003527.1~~GAHX01003527.1.p1  ORF type:complete len:71 (-),score=11.83 GAHX01003527.1:228-440(-)
MAISGQIWQHSFKENRVIRRIIQIIATTNVLINFKISIPETTNIENACKNSISGGPPNLTIFMEGSLFTF